MLRRLPTPRDLLEMEEEENAFVAPRFGDQPRNAARRLLAEYLWPGDERIQRRQIYPGIRTYPGLRHRRGQHHSMSAGRQGYSQRHQGMVAGQERARRLPVEMVARAGTSAGNRIGQRAHAPAWRSGDYELLVSSEDLEPPQMFQGGRTFSGPSSDQNIHHPAPGQGYFRQMREMEEQNAGPGRLLLGMEDEGPSNQFSINQYQRDAAMQAGSAPQYLQMLPQVAPRRPPPGIEPDQVPSAVFGTGRRSTDPATRSDFQQLLLGEGYGFVPIYSGDSGLAGYGADHLASYLPRDIQRDLETLWHRAYSRGMFPELEDQASGYNGRPGIIQNDLEMLRRQASSGGMLPEVRHERGTSSGYRRQSGYMQRDTSIRGWRGSPGALLPDLDDEASGSRRESGYIQCDIGMSGQRVSLEPLLPDVHDEASGSRRESGYIQRDIGMSGHRVSLEPLLPDVHDEASGSRRESGYRPRDLEARRCRAPSRGMSPEVADEAFGHSARPGYDQGRGKMNRRRAVAAVQMEGGEEEEKMSREDEERMSEDSSHGPHSVSTATLSDTN